MNFDQRTDVTREAITRCCEAEGLFPPTQRQAGGIVQQALPQHIGPIRASDQGPSHVLLQQAWCSYIDHAAHTGRRSVYPTLPFDSTRHQDSIFYC